MVKAAPDRFASKLTFTPEWRTLFVLVTLLSLPARGAEVERALTREADAIVIARVARVVSEAAGSSIQTNVTLVVESSLKGSSPLRTIRLRERGGMIGKRALHVSGSTDFATGDRFLLFLDRDADGTHRTVRGNHGAFRLEREGEREIAVAAVNGEMHDAKSFIEFIRESVKGSNVPDRSLIPGRPIGRNIARSRYNSKRGRTSDGLTVSFPIRWEEFATPLEFRPRGSQPGAVDGGLASVQAALAAWTAAPDSTVQLSLGAPTTNIAEQDGISTIQFADPENRIAGSFSETTIHQSSNFMPKGRAFHASTLIQAAGDRVLVTGGETNDGIVVDGLIFNPSTETFSATTNAMRAARIKHQAVTLNDGSGLVFVAGGRNGSAPVGLADLYDPVSSMFSAAGSDLTTARHSFTATQLNVLSPGHVLIAGGSGASGALASLEYYFPQGEIVPLPVSLNVARTRHMAVELGDGRVLIFGGYNGTSFLGSAEIYDPGAIPYDPLDPTSLDDDTVTSLANGLNTPRADATAAVADGADRKILIAGGVNGDGSLISAEIFNPDTNSFYPVGDMTVAREGHTMTMLTNNRLAIVGGADGSNAHSSVEFFKPVTEEFSRLQASMTSSRYGHTSTALGDGRLAIIGGTNGTLHSTTEVLDPADSFELAIVEVWANVSQFVFAGTTFSKITEVDITLQDGLAGAGLTNGGLDQLITNTVGQALGLATVYDSAVLNDSFDFAAPPFGAALQPYDLDAAKYVYPTCPSVSDGPDSVSITSGSTTTLAVTATGGSDLHYQWYRGTAPDTTNAVGTDSAAFITPELTTTTPYWVRVWNDCGSINSGTAVVTVTVPPPPSPDIDQNGSVNAADIAFLARYLFAQGAAPMGNADLNNSGAVEPSDVFFLINHVMAGGPASLNAGTSDGSNAE